jgi:hypothetical protein
MLEPLRLLCDVGYGSRSVRTVTSIRLSGMVPDRTCVFDCAGSIPWGVACELERLSTTISNVEENKGNAYTLQDPKFVSERYILVVVIVAEIIQGACNICVVEGHKK